MTIAVIIARQPRKDGAFSKWVHSVYPAAVLDDDNLERHLEMLNYRHNKGYDCEGDDIIYSAEIVPIDGLTLDEEEGLYKTFENRFI